MVKSSAVLLLLCMVIGIKVDFYIEMTENFDKKKNELR